MKLINNIDVPQRDDAFIEGVSSWLGPLMKWYFRSEVRGLERIPEGPGLYVGNHNAGLVTPDTYIFSSAIIRSSGMKNVPYGLGHEVVFSVPGVNQLFTRLGVMRAAYASAAKIFDAGLKALVYPGGDIDSMRPWRDRHRIRFGSRRGYIRLALKAGVPLIPVVAAGAHGTLFIIDDLPWLARLLRADKLARVKVFPLAWSFPLGFTLGPLLVHFPLPTKIIMEVLEPIEFERTGEDAASDTAYVVQCADRVEHAMQEALTRLSQEL